MGLNDISHGDDLIIEVGHSLLFTTVGLNWDFTELWLNQKIYFGRASIFMLPDID